LEHVPQSEGRERSEKPRRPVKGTDTDRDGDGDADGDGEAVEDKREDAEQASPTACAPSAATLKPHLVQIPIMECSGHEAHCVAFAPSFHDFCRPIGGGDGEDSAAAGAAAETPSSDAALSGVAETPTSARRWSDVGAGAGRAAGCAWTPPPEAVPCSASSATFRCPSGGGSLWALARMCCDSISTRIGSEMLQSAAA